MSRPLLFDLTAAQGAGSVVRHGGGRYAEVVFSRILSQGRPVVAWYDSRRWLSPHIEKAVKEVGVPLHDVAANADMEGFVARHRPFAAYTALINPWLKSLEISGLPVIATLHGLRDMEMPADRDFWNYKGQGLREKVKYVLRHDLKVVMPSRDREEFRWFAEADDAKRRILAVSEHTRHSLSAFFPGTAHLDIPVFYSPATSDAPCNPGDGSGRYFLMVSGNRPTKNNLRAIRALDGLFQAGLLEDFSAVVTGAGDPEKLYRYRLRCPERFRFLGYVDDAELEDLYHRAWCFVYPTLNEGFGYPPVEAMRHGVPVIASPYSSVPEVVGDAGLYVNPMSVDEMKARMLQMGDPVRRAALSQAALRRHAIVTGRQKRDLDAMVDWLYRDAVV